MLSDQRQAGSFLDTLQSWGDPKPEMPPEPSEPEPMPEEEDDAGE